MRQPETEAGEIWKPVAGHEDRYLISNHGRVWSVHRKSVHGTSTTWYGGCIFHLNKMKNGRMKAYIPLGLGKCDRRFIDEMVLSAFDSGQPEGAKAKHLDGMNGNSYIDNLEWFTKVEN